MQVVEAAFTAEEKDTVRKIAENVQVSWHKQSILGSRTFTIGVSTIGGNDVIGINPGAIGSPGNYKYFDESNYVISLGWERGYNMPTGGLTKALAEAVLDNTSGRFTPRHMGGNSELFTAQPLRSPIIINAGFNYNGLDQVIPQFAGLITEQPKLSIRDKTYSIKAADFLDYFQNKYTDQNLMFTAQRTDQVLTTLSSLAGMNTAQYDYDYGINVIPFGYFPTGTKFADIVGQLVEAENGHFYQDESGILKFENRQHWQNSPYTSIQKIITTSQVIDAESPNLDHLINVVEVKSQVREKQPSQLIFTLSSPVSLPKNQDTEIFVNFDDPILAIDTYSFIANSLDDGSGVDISSSVTLKSLSTFAQAAKFILTNSSSLDGFLTQLFVEGRPAKVSKEVYYRATRGLSITAYQERSVTIVNDFISNTDIAQTLALMLINDYSTPENLQKITIKAMPELQLGDLVSWQGRYWRIFDIKSTLDVSAGFISELTMVQRTLVTYFRIGISTIGGTDKISP